MQWEKAGAHSDWREPQRESNQRRMAGARFGRQERGNDFEVIFQSSLIQKNFKGHILEVLWGITIEL